MLLFESKKRYGSESDEPVKLGGVSPLLCMLLRERGVVTDQEAHAFLHPSMEQFCDPMRFGGMDRAVKRIGRAIEKGERICVFGDYDVDGMCALSILILYLKERGAQVTHYIPKRQKDGYGMSKNAVTALKKDGVKLIITVDNGIKAIEEVALCRELGMDVIVTDHHQCGQTLPDCEAIVCPTVPGDDYRNKHICGAGVALKLVEAMGGRGAVGPYFALAGIATIADVVPLLGENRAFAALGLDALSRGDCPVGIRVLGELSRGEMKRGAYTVNDVAYGIAPRLNASGRMGDAALGVRLLCADDESAALKIAAKLDKLNQLRQEEEAAICNEACALVDRMNVTHKPSIVLKSANWHQGVIGIAASRIAERYYRPTVLFSEHDGILTGSARSIPHVDLYAALNAVKIDVIRFGGHAQAAGITLAAADFDAFCEGFDTVLYNTVKKDAFIPRRFYEVEAGLSDITLGAAKEIMMLEPFGEGNPMPLFMLKDAAASHMRRIGREGMHLDAMLHKGPHAVKSIAFGMGARFDEILHFERMDALFSPMVDTWNGMQDIKLRLHAVRRASIRDARTYVLRHETHFYDAILNNILYNDVNGSFDCIFTDIEGEAKRLLHADIAGTAILCFTKSGAIRFLKDMADNERFDLGFFQTMDQPCAYNAGILAPDLARLRMDRYENVVIYDTPISRGILARLRALAPNARLFVSKTQRGEAREMIEGLQIGRDGIIPYYRSILKAGRRFFNEEELVNRVCDRFGGKPHECRLAARVFSELGFLAHTESGGIVALDSPAHRDLEESATFMAAASLYDQNEAYEKMARLEAGHESAV